MDETVKTPPYMGETAHHEGTTCPFCGLPAVCGHPVKIPPLAAWVPNVWVKGP
jgi:hypothetical protein